MKSSSSNDETDDQGRTEGGSLYQKPGPEHRQRSPTPGRRDGSRGRKAPDRSSPDAFWKSARTFLVVAAGMGLLFYLALTVNRKSWERKTQRAWQNAARNPSAQPAGPPPPSTGIIREPNLLTGMVTDTAFDSAALRQAVALTERAQDLAKNGAYEQAAKTYREALAEWPLLNGGWARLGRVELQAGRHHQAQRALSRAVETHPGDADLLNDLGVAFLLQNRPEKAREAFEQALTIAPEHTHSLYNLALSLHAQNDVQATVATLERYLKLKPDTVRALRLLAYLEARQGRYREAHDHLQRALTLRPNWVALYLDLAAVTALRGENDEALAYLKRAEKAGSATQVYRLYQEPAFHGLRLTHAGRIYEEELLARTEQTLSDEPAAATPSRTQPIVSASSPSS